MKKTGTCPECWAKNLAIDSQGNINPHAKPGAGDEPCDYKGPSAKDPTPEEIRGSTTPPEQYFYES